MQGLLLCGESGDPYKDLKPSLMYFKFSYSGEIGKSIAICMILLEGALEMSKIISFSMNMSSVSALLTT